MGAGAVVSVAAGDTLVVGIEGTHRRSGAVAAGMGAVAMAGIVTPMGAGIRLAMVAVMLQAAIRLADSMRGEVITMAIASGRGLTSVSGWAFRLGMATMPVVMPIADADTTMDGAIGSRHLAIRILTTVTSI